MKNYFENKIILVTGGCGSIGSEIVRQLLKFKPKAIRIFDNDEANQFKLAQELKSNKIRSLIGDVRDYERVMRAMNDVDIVFHAAALKHVPLCEYNPFEAVNTNVIGTKNLVNAAIHNQIDIFVGISTDKAVNPINTMGATKLLSEKIITNAPIGTWQVKFCCVRFGNVLNSVGSVIPIFKEQIKKGGPITITHNEMTRFFMSLKEAVSLVIKSAEIVKGGETFILKMPALKVLDLAKVMVEELAPKYGFEPKKIVFKTIGVRPGEKIHEALMSNEEAPYMVEHKQMLILYNSLLSQYGSKQKIKLNRTINLEGYNSETIGLLSKDKIKKKLYELKIIE